MSSRLRKQDGASAIVVAISLLLLVGAGAIAIDLGSAWATKRSLVVDTDSGAMAAARVAADENVAGGGCTDEAKQAALDFVSANVGRTVTESELDDYDCYAPFTFAEPNTIRVDFTDRAQQTLSGALGVNDVTVFASSIAEFNGNAAGPLRPIAVCNSQPEVDAAFSTPPPDDGVRMLVSMERTWVDAASCGGTGGFWYWLCFASNCGQVDVNNYLASGYTGSVDLNDELKRDWDDPARDEDCDPPPTPRQDVCYTSQGSVGNLSKSTEGGYLQGLLGQTFSILIIDKIYPASDTACDARPCVHPYGFAYVGLEAVCQRGNAVPKATVIGDTSAMSKSDCHTAGMSNGDIVFAFRLFKVTRGGTPQSFVNPNPPAVELCGADNDPGTEPHRCDGEFSD